jgi:hypothetical protein
LELVVALRSVASSLPVTLIVAPTIAAPFASFTVPSIVEVV